MFVGDEEANGSCFAEVASTDGSGHGKDAREQPRLSTPWDVPAAPLEVEPAIQGGTCGLDALAERSQDQGPRTRSQGFSCLGGMALGGDSTSACMPITFALGDAKTVVRDLIEIERGLVGLGQVFRADRGYASAQFETELAVRGAAARSQVSEVVRLTDAIATGGQAGDIAALARLERAPGVGWGASRPPRYGRRTGRRLASRARTGSEQDRRLARSAVVARVGWYVPRVMTREAGLGGETEQCLDNRHRDGLGGDISWNQQCMPWS